MEVHLVDATYELFRAHFSPRPPVLGRDGEVLSGGRQRPRRAAVLPPPRAGRHARRLRHGPRHRVVPQRPLPGLQDRQPGMPPELLAQFPIAEAAIEALGVVLWSMVEFEADDAIAAAAERFAADPRVERILICTPDKDMAQLRRAASGSCSGTAAGSTIYDDAGRAGEVGRRRPRASRTAWPSSGDAADGFPGCPAGATSRASAVLARYGHLEAHPRQRLRRGTCPGSASAVALAATLRDRMDEALLYRDLARLRTTRRRRPDPAAGRRRARAGSAPTARAGRRSATSGASTGLRDRPHRWLGEARTPGQEPPRARDGLEPFAGSPDSRRMLRVVGRRRRDDPERLGSPCRRRTRARRPRWSRSRPPRSAISPAAATSHADMPPVWTNASNRPFAT